MKDLQLSNFEMKKYFFLTINMLRAFIVDKKIHLNLIQICQDLKQEYKDWDTRFIRFGNINAILKGELKVPKILIHK